MRQETIDREGGREGGGGERERERERYLGHIVFNVTCSSYHSGSAVPDTEAERKWPWMRCRWVFEEDPSLESRYLRQASNVPWPAMS
jgi:hypothetical protein